MKPAFRILAGGDDVSAKINDRLIRLNVTDEAGYKSDELIVEIDNRGLAVAVPRKGETLELSLGYGDALIVMGRYIVDEVASAGPVRRMIIKAKAADMLGNFSKHKKTRTWGLQSIGDIVAAIAAEHGLTPNVSAALSAIIPAPVPYAQLDQTNEADGRFLTRIAREYDAVAKPAYGMLIFAPAGEAKAASGRAIPSVTLNEGDVTSWRVRAPERGKYKAAKAYWMDTQTQTKKSVTTGDEEPAYSLTHIYGDAQTAESAASSKLAALNRAGSTLSLSLPGTAALGAEGALTFQTDDALAAGAWVVTRAEHELTGGSGGGFATRLDCEIPKGGKS